MKILIVDDNECNRYQLEVLLSGSGYDVQTAAHGSEALEKARQVPPDLIISDVLMPVMDGFSLCREWRKDERLRTVPFVFYTATYTDERDRDFALSLGANRFIVKPEEPDVFVRDIREVIDQSERGVMFAPPPAKTSDNSEDGEAHYLREYNQVLVHKLEDKLVQLDQTRRELERDIARRERAEHALRLERERLELALNAARFGVWDWDLGTNRMVWSERHAVVLGLQKDQLGGTYADFENCVHPDDRSGLAAASALARDSHTVLEHEFRVVWPDSSTHWVGARGRFIYDDAGRPSRMTGVTQDVTERRQMEAERHRLEAQMHQTQKLESLGLLAGGIAHDFNNLLTAIVAHTDLMVGELPPESPGRPHLQQIGKAADRAGELCRQLLAYSGRGRLVIEPLNLSRLVEELIPLLKVSISKKVALECHFAPNLPNTEADPTQLRQVVMNLVINASEAIGGQQGVVTISTGSRKCDAADLGRWRAAETAVPGDYVYVEVSDTGCGMDSETQARIFEPFFTTKFTGRGLGLAAVLGIAQSHRCAIDVQSTPGKGTAFRVLFPASAKEPPCPELRPCADQWRGNGTILVVDDEEGVRNVAALMVARLGFSAITASDGCEAVALFGNHSEQIRCVLLDLTMPKMSGEEAARELMRLRPGVPIILTSGYSVHEITLRFANQPVAGFISKPYQLATLRATLRQVLEPSNAGNGTN